MQEFFVLEVTAKSAAGILGIQSSAIAGIVDNLRNQGKTNSDLLLRQPP